MHSYLYKIKHPDHIFVYIEEFDSTSELVVFDFVDSDDYISFLTIVGESINLKRPSMIELTNYRGKKVMPNTAYAIAPEAFEMWLADGFISQENTDSYLIGHRIKLQDPTANVFGSSITLPNEKMFLGYQDEILLNCPGKIEIAVRDVGQGSWNEVHSNGQPILVFDIGTCTNASKSNVAQLIESRREAYELGKPILILSHWDKDHYHCLLGMSESQIKASFAFFICRGVCPNLTSEKLFAKMTSALGFEYIRSVPAHPSRKAKKVSPRFVRLTKSGSQITLYNAGHNKDRNISGLAISIKTVNGSVILGGDALYEQLSRDILPTLNYSHTHNLVVPHHGGKAGKFTYKKPFGVKFGEAIISVGANPYGHPLEKNVDSLKAEGFRVRQTKFEKEDIVITL